MPDNMFCKKQGAVSHSSSEAEIISLDAGVRMEGLTYGKFINGLEKSKIKLDRKVLAELAYNNPEVFKSIVKKVQSSLN